MKLNKKRICNPNCAEFYTEKFPAEGWYFLGCMYAQRLTVFIILTCSKTKKNMYIRDAAWNFTNREFMKLGYNNRAMKINTTTRFHIYTSQTIGFYIIYLK